jgi:hypothetical protein
MIGGLLSKSVSRVALFAAAGLFVGGVAMPSAKAADLGGDCCADLEERVAELEATTARKGTRQVSLTISGQVTRSVLYWNSDIAGPATGNTSGTYAGIDNHNQSTRFTFSGSAKISPNLKAGFEMMTEITNGPRTSNVDQDNVDGTASTDPALAVRTANWWLESSTLGRVTVGRINLGGPVGTIDLGGISTVAHFSPGLVGGSFIVENGCAPACTLRRFIGPTYGGDRIEGIRYDTPSIGGFVAQASWGEDDVWSASLRYAGEFSGFRLAAGIGYQRNDGVNLNGGLDDNTNVRAASEWSGSIALMHVPSGLFAQGHYARSEFDAGTHNALTSATANQWLVQAGITKNWFGLGNTSLYGEYGRAEDQAIAVYANVVASNVDFYGVGAVQQIDAAAMELYLGWRRFESDVTTIGTFPTRELDLVHGGARIRF